MLSNDDILKLTTVLSTKEDLRQIDEEISVKMDLLRSDVYSKLDGVYKEVLTLRPEQVIHQVQHDDINQSLAEIKTVPAVAHEVRRVKK